MGILRVLGTIDLDQYWPDGEADADTTKVRVDVAPGAFAYAEDGETFKRTNVFDDAKVVGKSRQPVIRNGRIVVRLQGIDAPELHYRASALPRDNGVTDQQREQFNQLNKTERRQYWAETATIALHQKLARFGNGKIACKVTSFVDHPYELVDTYGRVVGNIQVGENFATDINTWLAEEAWVVPTFYSSMSADEIKKLLDAMQAGNAKGRVLKAITGDTKIFDENLLYRKHGPAAPQNDQGPVLMPKLFRRQVAYRLQKKVGIVGGTFKAFLTKSPDACFELKDFLEATVHSASERKLSDFIEGTEMTLKPHEFVFKEKFSSVVGPDGKRLEEF